MLSLTDIHATQSAELKTQPHLEGESWPVTSHARYLLQLEWMGQNTARASDGTCGPMWRVLSDLTYYLCFLEKYSARVSIISQCSLMLRDELFLTFTLERKSHSSQ